MRDLIRNYKLTIQRKREDSDTETEPLVGSSSSSTISFGTIRPIPRVFDQDSYSSESDAATAAPPTTTSDSLTRKPLHQRSYVNIGTSKDDSLENQQKALLFDRYNGRTLIDVYPVNNQLFYEKYQNYTNNLNDSGIIDSSSNFEALTDFNMTQLTDSQEKRAPTQNSIVTIFSIWNTTMGSSLLAMAWGMQKAGLIPGIVITILVGTICFYTAYLLLNVNEKHGVVDKRIEVCDLCRMLIGSWADIIARIFSVVVLVGACIVYWVLMSNFLYNAVYFIRDVIVKPMDDISDRLFNASAVICPKMQFNLTINNNFDNVVEEKSNFEDFWQLYSTVPILLAVFIFPVLNFKNATFFTKFNSLGTLSAIYLIIFVIFKTSVWGINIPSFDEELMVKPSFAALSGMLSLSFFIHNIILSILKNNKHQENNTRDLSIAFALVALTYLTIGAFFYTAFPMMKNCIEDNLLNNFNQYDVLTLVARLLLLFQLITVYPLLAFMLRQDILVNINKFFKSNGDQSTRFSEEPTFSLFRVLLINLILLVICVLFACFLPKIGTLIRYIGALSGLFYIHLFPSRLLV